MTHSLSNSLAKALVLLLIVLLSSPVLPAFGEEGASFADQSCRDFRDGKEFVEASSMSCLAADNTRNCLKQARSFFSRCRYSGSYTSLRSKFSMKMLAVLLLGRGRTVPEQRQYTAERSAPILARRQQNEGKRNA